MHLVFLGALSLVQASGTGPLEDSAPFDVSTCVKPDGSKSPCMPGNQECTQFGFDHTTPQFHVRDNSCGENDPNGPVYDPVHGVYHLHYQNHVGLHGGRTYGHAVSRDFVHWAHMPISIWNDHDYDSSAIYTGSATVVDGKVVQIYPGLCNPKEKGCPGGTNLCIAVPADESDVLQTNWTKEVYTTNPIIPNTGRDPSTAWKTASGEWRLTTFDTIIYGSMDFKTWYKIGKQPGFPGGECPSFFPMVRDTPGAGPAPPGAKTYTHVHKASHGGDWMQVGTYVENGPKQNGEWTAEKEVKIDMGHFYASKDFWDPVKKRRINYGWATVPPQSTQTLPREVTWNPELQQLVYSPVEEQKELRAGIIGSLKEQVLTANKTLNLGLPKQLGNQSEVIVSFQRPSVATHLSVKVMATAQGTGVEFFVDYVPPSNNGVSSVRVGSGTTVDTLKLSPNDKTIDMRLFVDNTFTEAYWMGGRVAMTIVTAATEDADVTVGTDQTGVTLASATVWKVGSIWVSPEEVKKTPRMDGAAEVVV